MPALIEPSPMTAMTLRFSPFTLLATAIPRAAEILVEEWAVPKASYWLSARFGNPDKPPN